MTQDEQGIETAPSGATRPPRRRRRWAVAMLALLALVVVLPLAAGAGLWLRLGAGPMALPDALVARIEARIDAAMTANRLTIGRILIARAQDDAGLDLSLRDLRLTDPDGAIRAAFPALVVNLSGEALLQGDVAPVRVDLQGAGIRLARDAAGRIDLALMAGDMASEINLGESLARLERMFATPVFARLEAVTARGLELVMADAMTGQTMRVRDAQMRLVRDGGALSLRMGGALEGSRDATIDVALGREAHSGVSKIVFAFEGLAARDIATLGPALAWVDLLRAPVSGRVQGQLGDDGSLGDLAVVLDIGAGVLRLAADAEPIRFDGLQIALRYDAAAGRLQFDRVDLAAPLLRFAATGHADLAAGDGAYLGQFSLSQIVLAPPGAITGPIALDHAMIDLRLALAPELRVEIGQAVIAHDGHRLLAHGQIAAREGGLALALDLAMAAAETATVLDYWPPEAAPVTRAWLQENVTAGRLSDIAFALRTAPETPPRMALSFGFAGGDLRVLPDLPPIRGAAGVLGLVDGRLDLRLDEGQMTAQDGGAVSFAGSRLQIADTGQIGPQAQIDLALDGALGDLLRLLQAPPVRLLANGPMTPDRLGTGHVNATASIATRFLPPGEGAPPVVSGQALIRDFRATALVPGRELTAAELTLDLDPKGLRIGGRAALDGVALSGTWARALGPDAPRQSQLLGQASLGAAQLSRLGVALPAWMMQGESVADIALDLPDDGPPALRITSDLAGAGLALPPLGWRQGANATGLLDVDIVLGAEPAVRDLALRVDGLDLSGRIALDGSGGFRRLSAQRFALGSWLDVTGVLVARGAGQAPGIEITGGTLDLRGAPQITQGGPRLDGGPITATLDRLQLTEGIAISPLIADLTTQGGLSGQFRGRVNGEAQVTGTLLSAARGPAVRLRAEDGGAVLRAAGIFQSARGGEMELILEATGDAGNYDGLLRIDGPRLRNAPVMAEILNIISVVGLIEQLSAEGISLGTVEARFRIAPTELILTEGVAIGPSLGLSLDGRYDLRARALDMAGVISPLNAVNGLFGAILGTRREGLFGFAYTLTGSAENPQVTVNPLSILTPGVFREIFRNPPPN